MEARMDGHGKKDDDGEHCRQAETAVWPMEKHRAKQCKEQREKDFGGVADEPWLVRGKSLPLDLAVVVPDDGLLRGVEMAVENGDVLRKLPRGASAGQFQKDVERLLEPPFMAEPHGFSPLRMKMA